MADRRNRESIEDMARIQAGLERIGEKLARGEQITEEPEEPKEKNLWDDTELEFDEIIWQEPEKEPAQPMQPAQPEKPTQQRKPVRQNPPRVKEESAEWEKYRVPIEDDLYENSFGSSKVERTLDRKEVYEEPTYEEAKYEEPAYDELADNELIYGEQVYEEPAYGEPTYEDPAEKELIYGEQVYEEPAENELIYGEQVYQEPTYEEHEYEEPEYEGPGYEEPEYEKPEYEEPVYEEPEKEVAVIPVRRAEEEEIVDWDRKPTKEERLAKKEKEREARELSRQELKAASKKSVKIQANKPESTETVERKKGLFFKKKSKQPIEAVAKPVEKKRKKKHPFRKLLIFLCVLLFLYLGGIYAVTNYAYGKLKYEKVDSVAGEAIKDDGVINVLLIGNDSRENGEDGRSDAMILLSISKKTKKIYMTSLLRDMYVEIPGHDGNRLNAAYSFGGPELLMKTIEQNFGIEVNRYMQVNFEAFAGLVDAVDGVDLELTQEELVYVNGYLVEYNMLTGREQGTDNMDTEHPGMVHMNGPQALAYSRNRYLGTDFGRTERQRKVLGQVFHKLPKAAIKHPKLLINTLLPNLTTNMTKMECYKIALSAPWLIGYDIEQASIPLQGTYHDSTIRKMAVLEVDFEANKQFIQENIYGKTK